MRPSSQCFGSVAGPFRRRLTPARLPHHAGARRRRGQAPSHRPPPRRLRVSVDRRPARDYVRLRDLELTPHFAVDHGMSTSLYYVDPDGNSVELQVDNFDDWGRSTEFMRSAPEFAADPIGTPDRSRRVSRRPRGRNLVRGAPPPCLLRRAPPVRADRPSPAAKRLERGARSVRSPGHRRSCAPTSSGGSRRPIRGRSRRRRGCRWPPARRRSPMPKFRPKSSDSLSVISYLLRLSATRSSRPGVVEAELVPLVRAARCSLMCQSWPPSRKLRAAPTKRSPLYC